VDRDAIARAGRRREVLEVLEFEREREAALLDQIDAVVLEEEGPRIDRAAKALLSPAELDLLDNVLGEPIEYDDPLDGGFISFDQADDTEDESEIERLEREVEHSRARQQALERLAALLESPLPEGTEPEAAL
jgi:hypothetical protein